MVEQIKYIPARLKSAVKGGHVTGSEDIDAGDGKTQQQVNNEASQGAAALTQRVADLEAMEEIVIDGGEAQIATGSDFTNPDAAKRAKVATVGAVLDGMNDGVYDVSKRFPAGGPNNDGKFTLDYILNNANTYIPLSRRHGGMQISFVQSSDNKYVQARCTANEFTTDVTKWQGVDDEPTAGSINLPKSKGVLNVISSPLQDLSYTISNYTIASYRLLMTGKFGGNVSYKHVYLPVVVGEKYVIQAKESTLLRFAFTTSSSATAGEDIPFVSGTTIREMQGSDKAYIEIPAGCTYLLLYNGDDSTDFNIMRFNIQEFFSHDNYDYSLYNEWLANTSYVVGDKRKVLENKQYKLYICKTAHTSGATFDSTNWRRISLQEDAKNIKLGDNELQELFTDFYCEKENTLLSIGSIGDSFTFDIPAELFISGNRQSSGAYAIPTDGVMLARFKNFISDKVQIVITPHVKSGGSFPTSIKVCRNSVPLEASPYTVTVGESITANVNDMDISVQYGEGGFTVLQDAIKNGLYFEITVTKLANDAAGVNTILTKIIELPKNPIEIIENQNVRFEYGTLTNKGADSTEVTNRIRCVGQIPIPDGTTKITIVPPQNIPNPPSFWYNGIYWFDSEHTHISNDTTQYSVEHTYDVPEGAKFFRVRFIGKLDDGNFTDSNFYVESPRLFGFRIIPTITIPANSELRHIKLSQWNVGDWGYSNPGHVGEHQHGIDTSITGWEDVFAATKQNFIDLRADIFVLNEYRYYWDTANQHNAYNELLKEFYPYFHFSRDDDPDDYVHGAIASKFPIKSWTKLTFPPNQELSFDGKDFYECVLNVYGYDLTVVVVHIPVDRPAIRAYCDAWLADRYKDMPRVIISGDFNAGHSGESESVIMEEQYGPFLDNGYTLANHGYFGIIPTHETGGIDNTITLGFNIDYIQAGNYGASNHKPTRVELTSFI